MFVRYRILTQHVVLDHIVIRDLGREVLGSDGDGREEIRKGPVLRNIQPLFHVLGGVTAKECLISLAPDPTKTVLVNAALVDVFRERGL